MDGALTVIEFGDLSHRRRAQLWGDDPDPYDMAGDTLQWQPKRRHVGLQNGDGHLVASAGLVTTQLRAADGRTHDAVLAILRGHA